MQRHGATVLGVVPSALDALQPAELPSARWVFTWGEALPAALGQKWRQGQVAVVELLISHWDLGWDVGMLGCWDVGGSSFWKGMGEIRKLRIFRLESVWGWLSDVLGTFLGCLHDFLVMGDMFG